MQKKEKFEFENFGIRRLKERAPSFDGADTQSDKPMVSGKKLNHLKKKKSASCKGKKTKKHVGRCSFYCASRLVCFGLSNKMV